jgi:putative transposase
MDNSLAIWQGATVEVVEPAANGELIVRVHDGDVPKLVQVPAREVQPIRQAPAAIQPLSVIPEEEWNRAAERAKACRSILAAPVGQRGDILLEAARSLGLSSRTLFRDLRLLKASDRTSELLPGKGGRPVGLRLLASDVEKVIVEKLDEVYLQGNRPPLSEVIQEIQASCRSKGLAPPCDRTIRRRAAWLDAYEVMRAREGAKRAKYKLKPMVGHIEAAYPLSILQIDHTLADVILLSEDRREVLGRPWLTLAIDVRTRNAAGLYISFDPPSAVAVAMCLCHALLPKDEWLETLQIDKSSWPIYGKPSVIFVDNGKDFHSDALTRGCAELGIDLQYRPVGSPHYGGIIERLIGTFMGRCRLLPGATQRDVRERGDYDSEAHASMTLSEFTRWFANEVATQYHTRPHRTLNVPPLVAWQRDIEAGFKVPELAGSWTRHEVFATFLPFEQRMIRRTGIELWGITYWTPELGEWVGAEETKPVHYDPRDISTVYLRSPAGVITVAKPTRNDIPRVSLAEWRALRADERAQGRDPALTAVRDAGLQTRRQLINNTLKATRNARRLAAKNAHRQEAVDTVKPAVPAAQVESKLQLDINRPSPGFRVHHWSN